MNKGLSKPLKVRNVFHLTEVHEEKRKKFAEYVLNNNINTDSIFFTDECRVVLVPKLNKQNNYIRYSKEERKKLWNPNTQIKRENETPKFEQSIMIAGGICKYGLSNLVFCSGTQNNFSYKQFLLFMKKDMEKIKEDNDLNDNLIFQQDNAACHTSKESRYAIEILFGKNFIDWPPNSPDMSPIENVWAILKEKLEKRKIKNLDDLRENILDIWTKFPTSLCERLCNSFKDRIKYVKEFNGKRINKELLEKIKKERKEHNENFIPSNEDNEWISVKRDKNYRIVFNDKIVDTIKKRFIKQINKQKINKLEIYSKENQKLKKNEKNYNKLMTKKEYNKNIEEKRKIIEDYYDNMIKSIEKMKSQEFIINYLDKEKNDKIMDLMSVNLNNNFELDGASTNISNNIDKILEKKEDDVIDTEVKELIDRIFEKGRKNRVSKYIDDKIKVNNFFPYEPKHKRNDNNEDINNNSRDIFNILNQISNLNLKIKNYSKRNKERGARINIIEESELNKDNEEDSKVNMDLE